jgi:site-specific recombinase XerD
MVLQDLQVDLTGNSNKCVDLIARYLNENSPKRSTQNNWNHMKNLLVEYSSKEVIVNELNVKFVKGFADFMLNKGIGESTCNTLLGKVSCLMNYSVGLGLVSKNPFKEWKYYKVYKRKDSTLYIHPKSIEVMKELFLNECCVFNGRMWHYKNEDTIIEQLIDRRTTLFAKYLYLCGVLFNGLAPIDLCQIKAKELQIKTIKGNEYYAWDGKRQKTNVDVKVRIKKEMYSNFMIQTMLMFRNGEYLLPVLDGAENYNSDQKVNRVKKTLNDLTPALREWFEEVNQEIINKNVENKTDIPLIDLKCSYYSYRHSYAMQYLIKGGNILKLATRLGRSVNTISAYVQHLKEETDLIDDEEE